MRTSSFASLHASFVGLVYRKPTFHEKKLSIREITTFPNRPLGFRPSGTHGILILSIGFVSIHIIPQRKS